MTKGDVSNRLAALYERRPLQGYARWKVRTDPVYRAALEVLRGRSTPLLDLGCGIGLLPFFLREHGYTAPILGIDFDERKIDVARKAATRYRGVDFIAGDAREPLPEGHDVVLLDVLHYFDPASQQTILSNVARAVAAGGVVVIRQVIHDGSWRARFTAFVDGAARAFKWMKAERLELPTREQITAAFGADFDAEVKPLWGRMLPYNNYLFVFRRRATARPTG
ncbi:MAG TPA: class I SAM-dependent methyltransferase [Thermoanaerobaculia bacterium]